MRGIAASLTDQDIADLAAFYEQHGRGEGAAATPTSRAARPTAEVAGC